MAIEIRVFGMAKLLNEIGELKLRDDWKQVNVKTLIIYYHTNFQDISYVQYTAIKHFTLANHILDKVEMYGRVFSRYAVYNDDGTLFKCIFDDELKMTLLLNEQYDKFDEPIEKLETLAGELIDYLYSMLEDVQYSLSVRGRGNVSYPS